MDELDSALSCQYGDESGNEDDCPAFDAKGIRCKTVNYALYHLKVFQLAFHTSLHQDHRFILGDYSI